MLKALPQRFYAPCGCDQLSTAPVNTAGGCSGATICNDAYFSLATGARVNILGIGPGSNCQIRFVPKRGFVFDDGNGSGQFITFEPQVTMPAVNGGSVGAWTDGAQWPVLCGAVGTDPHSWRFIYAPTSGDYRLESSNGLFKFVAASSIPGVSGVCEQATTVGKMRPFGCYVADATVEDPAWALRRLGLFDGSLLVSYADGDGNLWVKCLNPATDTFNYDGTIQGKTIKYENLIAVDNAGVPIVGGLAVLDRSSVSDAVPGYFSATTGLFYRSPAHVRQLKTSNSNQALTLSTSYQNWSGHLTFDPAVILHPNVEISAVLVFTTQEQFLLGLFRDGVLIHTWDFDITSQPNNAFYVTYLDLAVPQGSHTYDIRGKLSSGTDGTTLSYSLATLKTLTD